MQQEEFHRMSRQPLSPDLLEAGASLASAILDWQSWCHRKVESLDLLEGRRGRRRISLDCSPRTLQWVEPGSSAALSLVPLTYMAKDTLRDFDVHDDQGRSIPVLGTESNGLLAAAAIAYLIGLQSGRDTAAESWESICRVTFGAGDDAETCAGELIMTVSPNALTATLIRDLARNFILIAALAPEADPRRQVIKYSYHWESEDGIRGGIRSRINAGRAGLGLRRFSLSMELNSLDSAQSYHLECSAPRGIVCTGVHLPPDRSGRAPRDTSRTPVGHAHGNYDFEAANNNNNATIQFTLDRTGLIPRVAWSALATTAIFAGLLFVPQSFEALAKSVDAATALLLFVPAILIALSTRGPENEIVAQLLLTLRILAYVNCLLLFVAGALLVLDLPEGPLRVTWVISGIVSGITFLLSVAGITALNVGRKG